MSTRYVWEKYNINETFGETTSKIGAAIVDFGSKDSLVIVSGNNYKISRIVNPLNSSLTDIVYSIADTSPSVNIVKKSELLSGAAFYPSGKYAFIAIYNSSGVYYAPQLFETLSSTTTAAFKIAYNKNAERFELSGTVDSPYTLVSHSAKSLSQEKGDYIDLVTRSAANSYPNDGIKLLNWYVYKGSDSIDPSSVSYSKDDLYQGEAVDIIVTPGNIIYGVPPYAEYQFSYSVDGGSTWVNAGSKVAATRKTMTVPNGAAQLQARVIASDFWGFTSTTYVYGPNLPVSQIKSYATVGSKLRAGAKIYAAVGGKIRQIQKGYATVGGKIRKMF